jgi:ATP-dependent protease La (LON) substrate-binding domain
MTSAKPRPLLAPGETRTYPVLPLRDIVVFPHMIAPLFVGRKKSILALEEAMRSDTFILLAAQKNASDEDPATEAIYEVGTLRAYCSSSSRASPKASSAVATTMNLSKFPSTPPSTSPSTSPSSPPASTRSAPNSLATQQRPAGRSVPAPRFVWAAIGPERSNTFTWTSVRFRQPRACQQIRHRLQSTLIPTSRTISCVWASITNSIRTKSGPTSVLDNNNAGGGHCRLFISMQ